MPIVHILRSGVTSSALGLMMSGLCVLALALHGSRAEAVSGSSGGPDYSVAQLNAMVDAYPDSAELRAYRAKMFSLIREHSKALDDYAVAYQLDRTVAGTWLLERSYVLGETGNYKAALEDLNKVMEHHPDPRPADAKYFDKARDLAGLLVVRAQLYYCNGQFTEAQKDICEHIRLEESTGSHGSPREYLLRGMIWKRLGQTDRAESDLKTAIRGFTQWLKRERLATDAYALRAKSYYELGDRLSAIKDCDRGINNWYRDYQRQILVQRNLWLGPILPFAIRGDIQIALRKYSDAVEDYKTVLVFDGQNPLAHARLAQAYQYAGKRDLAERSVADARRLGFRGDFTKFIPWDHIEL